jgi:DNA-binding transcriptional MerR regulator
VIGTDHFIRHARDLDFSVEDICQLLALSEHHIISCDAAEKIAHHHLRQVEGKIAWQRLIRSELKRMVEACGGGSAAAGRMLEAATHEENSKEQAKGTCPANAIERTAP